MPHLFHLLQTCWYSYNNWNHVSCCASGTHIVPVFVLQHLVGVGTERSTDWSCKVIWNSRECPFILRQGRWYTATDAARTWKSVRNICRVPQCKHVARWFRNMPVSSVQIGTTISLYHSALLWLVAVELKSNVFGWPSCDCLSLES